MSLWNKIFWLPVAGALLLAALPLAAQDTALDPASSVKIDLPADSPLTLISTSMGESRATARGGAIVLDLHMTLTLRNSRLQARSRRDASDHRAGIRSRR